MWIKGIFTKSQERLYSHVYDLYNNESNIIKFNSEIKNIKKMWVFITVIYKL
jgi:hypothetical protein